ncbi:hypothetical protein YC2023_101825 [Brassica napus]
MDGDSEEDSPKKTKRVPKPSRMKQSPYIENQMEFKMSYFKKYQYFLHRVIIQLY